MISTIFHSVIVFIIVSFVWVFALNTEILPTITVGAFIGCVFGLILGIIGKLVAQRDQLKQMKLLLSSGHILGHFAGLSLGDFGLTILA